MSELASILTSARQAWLADRFDMALELFRKAHASAPHDVRLTIELASYLGLRFEVAEAMELLRKAELGAAANVGAWYQLGLAYCRAYRDTDALRCFERAAQDGHQAARLEVVCWYERRGNVSRAVEILDSCDADADDVLLWKGRLASRHGDVDTAKACWQKLLDRTTGDVETKIAAAYELAALHDRNNDAPAAIQAALQAKRWQGPEAKQHIATAQKLAPVEQNFVATASNTLFRKWQAETAHRPVALLTGTPRSGTSLIARMLGMDPQVVVADEMEAYSTYLQPRMLAGQRGTNAAEVLDSLGPQLLESCRETYFRWLTAALGRDLGDCVLLDKFPSTTFLVPAFRRLFPNATIIMALRDPRDVVLSCFMRHLSLNPVSSMFVRLDLAVARCCAEWKAWLVLRERLPQPWVEIRYEDVVTGNYMGCRAALAAMGLEWQDRFANFQESLATDPVRSPSYAQLREPITGQRAGRWKRYEAFLEPQWNRLNQFAADLGYEG